MPPVLKADPADVDADSADLNPGDVDYDGEAFEPEPMVQSPMSSFARQVTSHVTSFPANLTDRFSARRQPFMVRRNYAYEIRSSLTFPLAAALAEGTFTGIVASKYFQAGPWLIAVITAAPMFGNILALLWSQLAEGKPKVPFINVLQVGVVICMASVGMTYFVPDLGLAALAFTALIIIARILASGIITLRSAVWRMNYPRALRGQIISRINGVYNTVLAGMVLIAAFILDVQPASYAIIYPVVALVSLIGVVQYSKIRVRGEGRQIRRFHMQPAAVNELDVVDYERVTRERRAGGPLKRLAGQVGDSFRLLREDKAFREYQWWQFILGASFMLMFPSLISMVSSEMTNERTQYVLAVVVLQLIPMMTGVVFLQVWAPIFDRLDLFRFRIRLGFAAISAHSLILLGALTNQLWIVAAGTFMVGVSMGGGQLAWQLGQNAFATKDNLNTYMGLHVMLTGLRGMFVPFLGVLIFRNLDTFFPSAAVNGTDSGRWLFAVSVVLCMIGTAGYWRMSRVYGEMQRDESER